MRSAILRVLGRCATMIRVIGKVRTAPLRPPRAERRPQPSRGAYTARKSSEGPQSHEHQCDHRYRSEREPPLVVSRATRSSALKDSGRKRAVSSHSPSG